MSPVAIVLGAGMGGRAVAARLAGSHHIVVVDRDEETAARGVSAARDSGGSAESAVVDLTDLAAVERFREDVLARLGRVDLVVHLVGGWKGSATVDADAIEVWRSLEPGIVTTVQTTSVAFREALIATSGRYLMVSSTSAARPTAGNVAYASAKSAAETWVAGLDHSFRASTARAHVLVVMALMDDAMREGQPDKDFSRYTHVADLADAVADLVGQDSAETRVVLAPDA